MKSRPFVLTVVLTLIGIVGVLFIRAYVSTHPGSLSAWTDEHQRPGYRLLYSSETPTHYFAIYNTGTGKIALCEKAITPISGDRKTSWSLLDGNGNDLIGSSKEVEHLTRSHNLVIGKYVEYQGLIVPVKAGYSGPIRIVCESGPTDGYMSTLFEQVIAWER